MVSFCGRTRLVACTNERKRQKKRWVGLHQKEKSLEGKCRWTLQNQRYAHKQMTWLVCKKLLNHTVGRPPPQQVILQLPRLSWFWSYSCKGSRRCVCLEIMWKIKKYTAYSFLSGGTFSYQSIMVIHSCPVTAQKEIPSAKQTLQKYRQIKKIKYTWIWMEVQLTHCWNRIHMAVVLCILSF